MSLKITTSEIKCAIVLDAKYLVLSPGLVYNRQMELDTAQWCAVTGSEATDTNWNKHWNKHWHRLPREVVGPPCLELFKPWRDMVLGNLL